MLIVQYTTYEHTVERSSLAEFMKNGGILRVMGHAQTACASPFLLCKGPGDKDEYTI